MNITIYTKSNCPNCVSAKQLLEAKGLEYSACDTETADGFAILESLREKYPHIRQMPAIFIDNQYVGGLAGLQAALKQVGL